MHAIAAQLAPSLRVASLHLELEDSYGELKDAHLQALFRLAYAAEARDPYTECHLSRIRAIAQAIGRRMGIEGEYLESLGYGAITHDLGKLRIPDSILINPGSLSDDEWAQMKKHPEWGAEIIGDNAFYDVARQVALCHHERWDGSGYPNGLAGEEIPLAARVVSVADVYDALTSARPYKAAWPVERALVELMRMRGKTLCPASVDVFMELWREGEIGRIDAETEDESLSFDFRDLYAA
jgi:putative two-component system response regulator